MARRELVEDPSERFAWTVGDLWTQDSDGSSIPLADHLEKIRAAKLGATTPLTMTRRVVDAVIQHSAPNGRITKHFLHPIQKSWEAAKRHQFDKLRSTQAPPDPTQMDSLLRDINGYYHVRYPLAGLPIVSDALQHAVGERQWWSRTPPALLTASPLEACQITDVVERTIGLAFRTIVRDGTSVPRRPYSLVTKGLHYFSLETFPIYDRAAARSIHEWAVAAVTDHEDRQRFHRDLLALTDGSGYAGIVAFYRQFWTAAAPEQREELGGHAQRLSEDIGARVTVVDLIDKLLWIAAGDPKLLGLSNQKEA